MRREESYERKERDWWSCCLVIMVTTPVLGQASIGKKRDLTETDQDSTEEPSFNPSDMKKPRIAAGEETIEGDRDYPSSPASAAASKSNIEEIKARINKYLEVRDSDSTGTAQYLISHN